jgi:signal transduction histidine kinase
MPISRLAFVRTTALLLAAGIAILVTIVAASLWLTLRSQTFFNDVVVAREIRAAAIDVLTQLQAAETGQRGYLLTQDEVYLSPFNMAADELGRHVERLRRAVGSAPDLLPVVDRVAERSGEKIAELRRTVGLVTAGQTAEALAIVRSDRGRTAMDAIRADIAVILAESEADFQGSTASHEAATRQLLWVTVLGAVAMLAMAAAAAWTIMQYTREIVASRSELEALNAGLEQRVRERTEALSRANEEIQRFAYIVTHDLRAPLVNIMGFTSELEATMKPVEDYVKAEGPAQEKLRPDAVAALETDLPEAIGFIRSSTRKMDALINAILKISREGSRTLKPEKVDIDALLEATAASVHHQASSAGGSLKVESDVGAIVTDKLSLDQILGNLLDNAIKYRAPDRPIEIVARARRQRHGQVVIEIQDNGRGIAASDHERVFELFRRSGVQTTPGEGIGLAHVRTMARNLGGDITLRSELGVGSTFILQLPPVLRPAKRSKQP